MAAVVRGPGGIDVTVAVSCPVDGREFNPSTPYPGSTCRGPQRRFCSERCSHAARQARARARYAYAKAMREYGERLAAWEDEQSHPHDRLPGMPELPEPIQPLYLDPYP